MLLETQSGAAEGGLAIHSRDHTPSQNRRKRRDHRKHDFKVRRRRFKTVPRIGSKAAATRVNGTIGITTTSSSVGGLGTEGMEGEHLTTVRDASGPALWICAMLSVPIVCAYIARSAS